MNNELREHIIKLFESDTRLDGRKLTDYRPVKVDVDVTPNAEGSARVKIGDTEVIVGVKVEVMQPYPDSPDEGSIMVGAELLPLSNPNFEPGPPGIQAVELARIVDRGIRESKCLDFKKLCIKEGEKIWMIIIDICTINDAGNLPDASALAAIAALKNMKFPECKGDVIDYKKKTSKGLGLTDTPLSVTVIKIGDKFIVDPDSDEEKAIDARLTVASLSDGTLCAMQKGGDVPLSAEDIAKMVDIGLEKGKELRKLVK
ncbi:MAG: exosome complex protein Rrp42 [Candidatus Woesearchaeota archaeon]|jgi:exosome complex component RRP42|nr:exosome complex protein Rrp42 [Candidatus Woesearchaeota archaeon]HJO01298.1 exosome complex protein Rrp42 [Candidatus Woesearchaeota archaeon]|tara:strand:+ start:94 stop:867 length:774 start_codon:yes stop_codon:yes gene_type:complete